MGTLKNINISPKNDPPIGKLAREARDHSGTVSQMGPVTPNQSLNSVSALQLAD